MQHPDEGTIHAWLDGELSAEEGAALEAHVTGCAECSAAVAEARGIIAASSRIVSALDVIPGGVIPAAAPRMRPWYASTQLRAAAAVLIVAGTTLLVVDRQDRTFDSVAARERSTVMSAPLADTDGAVQQEAAAAAAPTTTQPAPTAPMLAERDLSAKTISTKVEPTANQATTPGAGVVSGGKTADAVTALGKERADQPAAREKTITGGTLSAVVVAPAPEVLRQRALAEKPTERDSSARDERRARVNSDMALENVVVTGARAATLPDLKVLRTDTIDSVSHTVYEVRPGVQVTLTESQPAGFRQSTTATRRAAAGSVAAPARPPVAPPVTAAASPQTVTSITWTDPETGRVYILSGPLSREELEAIRRRLPAQKR